MKRALMTLALALTSVAAILPAHADHVAPGSEFCDITRPTILRGDGSPTLVDAHTKILTRAFARACRREAGSVGYRGTGRARAVEALENRHILFVGSDKPLSPEEWALTMKGSGASTVPVNQIPLYIDAWAIVYNIPCRGPQLKLRSQVLGLMYAGLVKTWDDRLLQLDNPWLATCAQTIRLARRVDDAAATDTFQDYLAKRNPYFQPYRDGLAPERWPTSAFACSGLLDAGMVNCVNSFRGSIGYMSLAIARQSRMKLALVENASGAFVAPSAATCTAAAATAVPPPGTGREVVGGDVEVPWVPATQSDWSAIS
ncbi:MAG: substrate-binding domain-containing protein, partial [Actinomycetota bacterium]